MTFQQRNATVMLASLSAVLAYFLIRVAQMLGGDGLQQDIVYRLWLIVIIAVIVLTIAGTILTNIVYGIVTMIETKEEPTYVEDERDKLIELKAMRVSKSVASLATFGAMLTFVLGQSALVMFTLLISAGLVAAIAESLAKLYFYRKGF